MTTQRVVWRNDMIVKAVVYRFLSPSFLAMWTCWCLRGVDAWSTDQVSANGDMMDARKSMYSTVIYPKLWAGRPQAMLLASLLVVTLSACRF